MEQEVDNAVAHVAHEKTGGWTDKILPVAALFVSFLSILLAWGNGEAMQDLVNQNKRLVEASSLPYLELYGSNIPEGNMPGIELVVANQGVGPAHIRTAEITVDGAAVADMKGLMARCCAGLDRTNLSTSTLMGRMLRPGDTIKYIRLVGDGPAARAVTALDEARRSERIVTRLCFCSVFDECWDVDSSEPEVRKVERCDMPALPYRD